MSALDLIQAGWTDTTRQVNGVTLHVIEAGPRNGPLVILLHGFPEFWWAWRHQITPLADQGYRVVVPDMRGYNQSEAPQEVSAYQIDILAMDVVALADAYGAARFRLVGHGWGGVVAWWVAVRHRQRLERVVIMDAPHPDVWSRKTLAYRVQALRSFYLAFFQVPRLPEATLRAFDFAILRGVLRGSARAGTFGPGAIDRYAEAWARPGSLTAMLNYYRAMREREASSEPARIAPPTLLICSGKAMFEQHHVAQVGLELCDDGRSIVVEGATHWLHLEEPKRVNAEIIEFLAIRNRKARRGVRR